MKLLVITQIIDKDSDFLGFFHRWAGKLAKRVELVNVICLKMGEYSLPNNVKVWSLGKEASESRLKYVVRFYKYIFALRKQYDAVFVHMNPIYIFLGGLFWRVWGKRVFLWHNHQGGNIFTRVGAFWSKNVFHTSPFAFCSRFKKAIKMPAGIDEDVFRKMDGQRSWPGGEAGLEARKTGSILYVGRISPIKGVTLLIKAVQSLIADGVDCKLDVVGLAGDDEKEYYDELVKMAGEPGAQGRIKFLGKIPNYQLPEVYNQRQILVNLSPSGLFDKTILEAMACQTLVLVSSKAFESALPKELRFKERDIEDLKNKLKSLLGADEAAKTEWARALREYVVENHSLNLLADKLVEQFRK